MIIEDLEDYERTCMICDKPDCRFTVMLWHYYNQDQSDTDIQYWLCDTCQWYWKKADEFSLKEYIKKRKRSPRLFRLKDVENAVRDRRVELIMDEIRFLKKGLEAKAYLK